MFQSTKDRLFKIFDILKQPLDPELFQPANPLNELLIFRLECHDNILFLILDNRIRIRDTLSRTTLQNWGERIWGKVSQ